MITSGTQNDPLYSSRSATHKEVYEVVNIVCHINDKCLVRAEASN